MGLDKNTKVNIAKREREKGLLDKGVRGSRIEQTRMDDADMIPLSPHAGYDSNRNVRAIQRQMEKQNKEGGDVDMVIDEDGYSDNSVPTNKK